jgi:hypothetical protein
MMEEQGLREICLNWVRVIYWPSLARFVDPENVEQSFRPQVAQLVSDGSQDVPHSTNKWRPSF